MLLSFAPGYEPCDVGRLCDSFTALILVILESLVACIRTLSVGDHQLTMALEENEGHPASERTPFLTSTDSSQDAEATSVGKEMVDIAKLGLSQLAVTFFRAWIIGKRV